jgi:hypothetical protein
MTDILIEKLYSLLEFSYIAAGLLGNIFEQDIQTKTYSNFTTTLPPSCADCLEIWETQPPGTLRACPDL